MGEYTVVFVVVMIGPVFFEGKGIVFFQATSGLLFQKFPNHFMIHGMPKCFGWEKTLKHIHFHSLP